MGIFARKSKHGHKMFDGTHTISESNKNIFKEIPQIIYGDLKRQKFNIAEKVITRLFAVGEHSKIYRRSRGYNDHETRSTV